MDLVVNPNHLYPIGIMYRCGAPCNKTQIWTNSIRGGQEGYRDLIAYLQLDTDRFMQGICNDKYCGKCFGYIQCLKNGYSWPGAHRNADLYGCKACDNKFAAWTDLYEDENQDFKDDRSYYGFYRFYAKKLKAPGDPLRKLMEQDSQRHNPYRRNADTQIRAAERRWLASGDWNDKLQYNVACLRANIIPPADAELAVNWDANSIADFYNAVASSNRQSPVARYPIMWKPQLGEVKDLYRRWYFPDGWGASVVYKASDPPPGRAPYAHSIPLAEHEVEGIFFRYTDPKQRKIDEADSDPALEKLPDGSYISWSVTRFLRSEQETLLKFLQEAASGQAKPDYEENRRNPDAALRQLERIANRTKSPEDIAKYDRAASRASVRVLRDTLGDFYEVDRQKYGLFLGRPIQFVYQGQDVWGRVADAFTGLSFAVLIPGDHDIHMVTDVYGWSQNPPWARDLPKMIRTGQVYGCMTSHWMDDPRLSRKVNPSEISEIQESSCDCNVCRAMCHRTFCWPTPQEANHLLDAGHLPQLDLDYHQNYDHKTQRFLPVVWAVRPKLRGTEIFPQGCIFQKEGLCELHGKHKPLEGRLAHHSGTPTSLRSQMAKLWDTPEGRQVVEKFKQMESRRNPDTDEPDSDLLNPDNPPWKTRLHFWGPLASSEDGRRGPWKYLMDWGSPAWKRKMTAHYQEIGKLLLQYGFEICPKCATQHTGLTMCCRRCNHSNRPKD